MKFAFILTALILSITFAAAPAFATCAEDIKAVSRTMTSANSGLSDADMQTALSLLVEVKTLCNNGDEAGAAVVLADLKALLGTN